MTSFSLCLFVFPLFPPLPPPLPPPVSLPSSLKSGLCLLYLALSGTHPSLCVLKRDHQSEQLKLCLGCSKGLANGREFPLREALLLTWTVLHSCPGLFQYQPIPPALSKATRDSYKGKQGPCLPDPSPSPPLLGWGKTVPG